MPWEPSTARQLILFLDAQGKRLALGSRLRDTGREMDRLAAVLTTSPEWALFWRERYGAPYNRRRIFRFDPEQLAPDTLAQMVREYQDLLTTERRLYQELPEWVRKVLRAPPPVRP